MNFGDFMDITLSYVFHKWQPQRVCIPICIQIDTKLEIRTNKTNTRKVQNWKHGDSVNAMELSVGGIAHISYWVIVLCGHDPAEVF